MPTSLTLSAENAARQRTADDGELVATLSDYYRRLDTAQAHIGAVLAILRPRAHRTVLQFAAREPLGRLMADITAHLVRLGGSPPEGHE